jgi:hypothetical protein
MSPDRSIRTMGAEFLLLEVLTSSQGDASTGTVTTVIVDALNLPIDYYWL